MKHLLLTGILLLLLVTNLCAQQFIYSKEGRAIISRESLIFNCLQSLQKPRSDKAATQICECQVSELDRRFSNQQYKMYTKKNVIDFAALVKEDSLVEQDLQDCFAASGKATLLQAESSKETFLRQCAESIRQSSMKALSNDRVDAF